MSVFVALFVYYLSQVTYMVPINIRIAMDGNLFYAILTNLFLLILTAQFNAKTTESERANYFLSLKSCSINKL